MSPGVPSLSAVASVLSLFLFTSLPARAELISHWTLDGTLDDSGP